MATYAELTTASNNSALGARIAVACAVAADKIRLEADTTPNHAARVIWARAAFANPSTAAAGILWSVLAQNRAATLAQITGADDAAVQTAVEAAIDAVALS
jgi:hypothetical protein